MAFRSGLFGPQPLDPTAPSPRSWSAGHDADSRGSSSGVAMHRNSSNEVPPAGAADSNEMLPDVSTLGKRPVRGRYESREGGPWKLELQLDLDDELLVTRVEGNMYRTAEGRRELFGSFTVHAMLVTANGSALTINGTAGTSWDTRYHHIRITIRRASVLSPPAAAIVEWSDLGGSLGAIYECFYASRFLATATRTRELGREAPDETLAQFFPLKEHEAHLPNALGTVGNAVRQAGE